MNKGLKEYNAFIENKEAAGFQDLREVTQKPRINEPLYPLADSKGNFKQITNKNIPNLPINIIAPLQEEKEIYEEEGSAMVDEDEENKKK